MEETVKVVEQSKGEENIAQPEQLVDRQKRAFNQRGSELEEHSKQVEELGGEMETCSAQPRVSTCLLRHFIH